MAAATASSTRGKAAKKGVALCVNLVTAGLLKSRPKLSPVIVEELAVRITQPLEQPRRPFDVSERECETVPPGSCAIREADRLTRSGPRTRTPPTNDHPRHQTPQPQDLHGASVSPAIPDSAARRSLLAAAFRECRRRMPPADQPAPGGGSMRCSGRRPSHQGRCRDAHVHAGVPMRPGTCDRHGRGGTSPACPATPRVATAPAAPSSPPPVLVASPRPPPRAERRGRRRRRNRSPRSSHSSTSLRRARLAAGIIAATRTRSSTGTRAQTSGAVKPPSECPTTTRWLRSPTAWTTVSA